MKLKLAEANANEKLLTLHIEELEKKTEIEMELHHLKAQDAMRGTKSCCQSGREPTLGSRVSLTCLSVRENSTSCGSGPWKQRLVDNSYLHRLSSTHDCVI